MPLWLAYCLLGVLELLVTGLSLVIVLAAWSASQNCVPQCIPQAQLWMPITVASLFWLACTAILGFVWKALGKSAKKLPKGSF